MPAASPSLLLAHAVEGAQDRAAAIARADGAVLVVADGAGGSGGGAAAAEALVRAVLDAPTIGDGDGWVEVLRAVDRSLVLGETTAVIVQLVGERIFGASVGDSGALVIDRRGEWQELTGDQRRKPLLGSRRAVPVPFAARLGAGTLLLASDGLLKYADPARIAAVAGGDPLVDVPRRLIDLVRLRSGALPDDVAVVLARAGLTSSGTG